MVTNVLAQRSGVIAPPTSLNVGSADDVGIRNALATARSQGQQPRLRELQISEEERQQADALLDDFVAATFTAKSEQEFEAGKASFAQRRGIDPAQLANLRFADLPQIQREVQGAKAIFQAESERRRRGTLTALQEREQRRKDIEAGIPVSGGQPGGLNAVRAAQPDITRIASQVQPGAVTPPPVAPQPTRTGARAAPPTPQFRTRRAREEFEKEQAKQAAREQAKLPKQRKAARGAVTNLRRRQAAVRRSIRDARKIIEDNRNLFPATGVFSLTDFLPRTPANQLRAALRTVRANLGFEELNSLRDASPTGGALGQVTEREISFLQAVQGDIGADQGEARLLEVLDRIERGFDRSAREREEAFRGDFGEDPPGRQLDFGTQEEAEQAIEDGLLVPGDSITVGGRRAVVE